MIQIEYRDYQEECVMSLRAEGHAGYAPKGQDIVCAAVSTLMQTLACSMDGENGCAILSDNGTRGNAMTVQAKMSAENRVMFELVANGLKLLAEQYPENVQVKDMTTCTDAMDLQYFADGGAAGGAEGGADAAPAEVQEPALRPAQERLARRSGTMKTPTGKTPSVSPSAQERSGSTAPPEEEPFSKEKPSEEPAQEPKKEQTPEQRRHAFGEMMRGEYNDLFAELLQKAMDEGAKSAQADPKQAALRTALSEAYGVDAGDVDGMIDAVKHGRVKDEAYYESLAQERGVSVKTARELDKMESDLRRANDQNARLQAMQQEAARQQRAAQIRAQWDAQAAQLKAQYPDFELQSVLDNPQVADLMRRGVSLPDAYRAAYFDHIMQQATVQTAQQVEQGVVARAQQRANRPSENGTRPGGAVTTHMDISNTTRRQREELERRARRGEKIVL